MNNEITIYLITNNINNKIYVGRTNNLKSRWKQHKYYNRPSLIHKALKKYGHQNFTCEILEMCTINNCIEREQFWMDTYDSYNRNKGYNIAIKAEGYFLGTRTLEHCQKISKSLTGKKLTKEHKEKMSKARKGRFTGYDSPSAVQISQYDQNGNFIKSYESITAASNINNIGRTSINNALSGRSKTSGGFIWKKI